MAEEASPKPLEDAKSPTAGKKKKEKAPPPPSIEELEAARQLLGEETKSIEQLRDSIVVSELNEMKKSLQHHIAITDKLMAERAELEQQIEKIQIEDYTVAQEMGRRLAEKEEKLRTFDLESERKIHDLKRGYNVRISSLESKLSEAEEKILEREAQLATLSEDAVIYMDFQAERQRLQSELQQMKKDFSDYKKKTEEDVKKLRFKYWNEKQNMKAEKDEMGRTIEREVNVQIMGKIGEKNRSIAEENAHLKARMKELEAEIEELRAVRLKMEQDKRQLTIDADINRQEVKDCAQHNIRQAKEIKVLQAKIRALEEKLSQKSGMVESGQKEAEAKYKDQITTLERQSETWRRAALTKTEELQKMRALTQEVLDQRSDLEKFFYDSLEHVKLEVQKQRAMQHQQQLQQHQQHQQHQQQQYPYHHVPSSSASVSAKHEKPAAASQLNVLTIHGVNTPGSPSNGSSSPSPSIYPPSASSAPHSHGHGHGHGLPHHNGKPRAEVLHVTHSPASSLLVAPGSAQSLAASDVSSLAVSVSNSRQGNQHSSSSVSFPPISAPSPSSSSSGLKGTLRHSLQEKQIQKHMQQQQSSLQPSSSSSAAAYSPAYSSSSSPDHNQSQQQQQHQQHQHYAQGEMVEYYYPPSAAPGSSSADIPGSGGGGRSSSSPSPYYGHSAQYNDAVSIPISDPEGMGGRNDSFASSFPSKKVDIRELSWDDKERVLRILFSKLNHGTKKKRRDKKEQDMDAFSGSNVFMTAE